MDFNVVKEISVECCESMYAIGVNYLKENNNIELNELLDKLVELGDNIRICDDINELFNYKKLLDQLVNRIEVIVNA